VECDNQSSPMKKSDDEQFSRDSQHKQQHYSLAKSRDKVDQKHKRYRFENIVSFALVASSENPSSI
jgi:hypothetical protein